MNNGSVVQLRDYSWPSGADEQLATLSVPVDAIGRQFGLSTEEWFEDGLGLARGFWCALPSGRVVSLVQYAHPVQTVYSGSNLSVDSDEFHEIGPAPLLVEALEGLGLTRADVTWVRPVG